MKKVILVLVALFVLPAISFGGEEIDFTWTNVQASYDEPQNTIIVYGNVTSPEAATIGENVELLTRPGTADQAWSMSTIFFPSSGFFLAHDDPGNGDPDIVFGVLAFDADDNFDGYGGQF